MTGWSRIVAGAGVLLCLWASAMAVLDGVVPAADATLGTADGSRIGAATTVLVATSALLLVAFPLVGLVIARSQPRHTVAWTFLLSGLFLAIEKVGQLTSQFGSRHGWSGGVVHLAAWSQSWAWFPGLGLVITVGLLHFPTGRPLSPRWR